MLWVRDQLEQNKAAPQRVAAVVFSPSHDRYVKVCCHFVLIDFLNLLIVMTSFHQSKIGAELAIPAAHRCELTRLAIDADPRVHFHFLDLAIMKFCSTSVLSGRCCGREFHQRRRVRVESGRIPRFS
jgi:hypothetical protein